VILFVYSLCTLGCSLLIKPVIIYKKKEMNLAKSELVPAGNVDNVTGLAGILGFVVASFPLKYLSLPLGASYEPSIYEVVLLRR
jgi:hypothetical protein